MQIRNIGFTLVELIVVITILSILGTIAFVSLQGYSANARDSTRISDVQNISKVIELYKTQEGVLPPVSKAVDVTFSGATIWQQGSFGEETIQATRKLSEVPTDPLTGSEFAYSRTIATGEYQVAAIMEKQESISLDTPPLLRQGYALGSFAATLVKGNYNGKYITHPEGQHLYIIAAPSILANEVSSVTIQEVHANKSFVYKGAGTPPATYSGAVDLKNTWNFSPTNVSGDIAVIHNTTVSELSTGSGKVDFIEHLQTYYAGTDVALSPEFQDISDINTVETPNEAIEQVNTYLQANLGGLGGVSVSETAVIASSEGTTETPTPDFSFTRRDYSSAMNSGGFYSLKNAPNIGSFAALKQDGSITAWGLGGSGAPTDTGYTDVFSTTLAFAALKADGSITTWGYSNYGGSGAPTDTGYTDIFSTEMAFAALKTDGSITAWGDSAFGGSGAPTDTGYTDIFSTEMAFAALKQDGSITAWGNDTYGGSGAPDGTGYVDIFSTGRAFAALHSDGSITAFGDSNYGGVGAPSDTGYTEVFSTNYSFAALKQDGSITAWGNPSYGGNRAPTGTGYTKIFSTSRAFTALKQDGSITAWGFGGIDAPTDTGYTDVFSTILASAALKADGSITAWGSSTYGGNGAPTGTGYTDIFSTETAFAALKADGSITAWGSSSNGGSSAPSGTGYTDIFSTSKAFAALHSDGSITAWGSSSYGGSGAPTGTGYLIINGGIQ